MKKHWIWIGGVLAVTTMGGLRLLGKHGNIFTLLGAMVVVIAALAIAVIGYMNKKW